MREAMVVFGVLALAAGCAGRAPEGRVQPPPAPSVAPSVAALPTADAGQAASVVAAPDAAVPEPAAPVPIGQAKSVLDPKKIDGAVMSRVASDEIAPAVEAKVSAVDLGQRKDWYETWELGFDEAGGKHHTIEVIAPMALPPPLVVGDRVKLLTRMEGGGPNVRWAIVIHASDGSLLLAVNEAPAEWSVSEGKPGAVDRGPSYDTRSYGAHFEHAGKKLDVAAGKWARFDVGDATFYVWGSGASRKLHAGKRPMPDYVGGWLDFAIVRAR